ncbi:MAG: hypothetical protein M3Z21_10740, partial [Pseudomonadota bacterium]|nr:hypothetical protein [Pseudomonadota bacterium]
FFFSTGTTPPGELLVSAEVLAGTEVLTSCMVNTRIASSLEQGAQLIGAITAEPAIAAPGQDISLRYQVENVGNAALEPANIEVLVVDPETGDTVAEFMASATLDPNQETTAVQVLTDGLGPGDYLAVLRAGPENALETLDSAPLQVQEPADLTPIRDLQARAKTGKVDLLWTPVPQAASYKVLRRVEGGAFEPVATGHVTDFGVYADFGLTNGVTYFYVVRWVDGLGRESPDSNEIGATPSTRRER